jgi:hypothetical protein
MKRRHPFLPKVFLSGTWQSCSARRLLYAGVGAAYHRLNEYPVSVLGMRSGTVRSGAWQRAA